MSRGAAPTAMRTPISGVRRPAMKDMTPYVPITARSKATPANPPRTAIVNRRPASDSSIVSSIEITPKTAWPASNRATSSLIACATVPCGADDRTTPPMAPAASGAMRSGSCAWGM